MTRAFDALERTMAGEGSAVESACGHCGVPITMATDASRGEARGPRPNDLTVCLLCAGVNRFDEKLQLVGVSAEELRQEDDETREQLEAMVGLVRAMWLSKEGGAA